MKNFFAHTRNYIFRGILAIIPIALCLLAVYVLYVLIDKNILAVVDQFVKIRHIPGLGIILVFACLYLLGLIVSNVVGKTIFHLIDQISQRIPIVKKIYQITKEFSQGLMFTEYNQNFKKVVLVDWNQEGVWVAGFVMGQIIDRRTNDVLLRVYMPQYPSPVAGFIIVVKELQTIDSGWTVEEALKIVISGGIISPKYFR